MNLSDNMPNCFNFDPYCAIASKWVTNLINKLIISYPKSVSSTHSVDQMKKHYKFNVSIQSPRFTTCSLMVFPFHKSLTDSLKTYRLIYL